MKMKTSKTMTNKSDLIKLKLMPPLARGNHMTLDFNCPLNFFARILKRFATNLGGGSSQNGRDSAGRRLGIKRGDGCRVKATEILVRQRGTVWKPGENVFLGRDHTIHAKIDGIVRFERKVLLDNRVYVNVEEDPNKPKVKLVDISSYLKLPNTADGTLHRQEIQVSS
jgi:large subunit ribosomal protein L27